MLLWFAMKAVKRKTLGATIILDKPTLALIQELKRRSGIPMRHMVIAALNDWIPRELAKKAPAADGGAQ